MSTANMSALLDIAARAIEVSAAILGGMTGGVQ